MQIDPTAILIALGVALGVGVSNFIASRAGGAKKTIELLKDQIAAQNDLIGTQASRIASLEATGAEQTRQLAFLQQLVTGIPDWGKLHAGIAQLEAATATLGHMLEPYGADYRKQTNEHMALTRAIFDHMTPPNAG